MFCNFLQLSHMASSVMDNVGKAVIGVWRAHTVLDESDEAESSPEAPDHFRKLRSSSSLNSLRMSLRKRLPLRSVQASSLPEHPTGETMKEQPKPSTVRKFTRSARNSINGVYQVGRLTTVVAFSLFICEKKCNLFLLLIIIRLNKSHQLVIPELFSLSLRGFRGPESFPVRSVW